MNNYAKGFLFGAILTFLAAFPSLSGASIFSLNGSSPGEVSQYIGLASSSYSDLSSIDGWTQLTREDLSFIDSSNGTFDNSTFVNGDAAAEIFSKGSEIVVSFRGTDGGLDSLDYAGLLTGNYIISGFETLLGSLLLYQAANPSTSFTFVGHSLGAGAVNQLRNLTSSTTYSVFDNANFLAVASPVISDDGRILNIGFRNDYVYQSINETNLVNDILNLVNSSGNPMPGYGSANTIDNVLFYNTAVAQDEFTGSVAEYLAGFGPGDIAVNGHNTRAYYYAAEILASSELIDFISKDDPVLISGTSFLVENKPTPLFDYTNSPIVFILGKGLPDDGTLSLGYPEASFLLIETSIGGPDDLIQGADAVEFIDAAYGDDTVDAGGGNDVVFGGEGDDVIAGEAGDDLIFPGLGADIIIADDGKDSIRGLIAELSGDTIQPSINTTIEFVLPIVDFPSVIDASVVVDTGFWQLDLGSDGSTEATLFDDSIGPLLSPFVSGITTSGENTIVSISYAGASAFVIDQSLSPGLASVDQATLGAMNSAGTTFAIGPTNINDGPSDPELRSLAVTDTGNIYTVFEYDAGENLSFGVGNALPPQFPGDAGGVIVELDPETGAFIPSTIRAFAFGSGGSVPNTPPDFGVDFVESINALAPLGGGEFLAIAEFRFSTVNPIRTLEGGPDFAFRIDTQGNTEFLVSWITFGDGDGTRTIAADTSPVTGEVFAWRDFSNSYGGGTLLRVDRNTGEPTVVANFSTFEITSIAFQSDGTLIGIGGDQFGQATIFEIDPIGLTIAPVQSLTGSFFPTEFDLFGDFTFKPETNGTSDDDTLDGTATDDRIDGGLGNDTLNGLDGSDDIFAGGGTDVIAPGLGEDVINVSGSTVDIRGTLTEIDGDRVRGFNQDDSITLVGTPVIFGGSVSSTPDALTLLLDGDGDGFADVILTFEGLDSGQPFVFETDEEGDVVIRLGEVNVAPVAVTDTFDVLSNEISFGNILANDIDENGDSLSIISIEGTAIDPDDTTVQIIDLPSGARITFLANGSLLYDPRGGFSGLTEGEVGTDTITYISTDGLVSSAPTTVTITITGAPDNSGTPPDGDLNDDGAVDLADLHLANRILLGEEPLTQGYLDRGDVAPLVQGVPDPDGVFEIGDVMVIQRKVLGIADF